MSDLLKQLSTPFPPTKISWRVGSTTQAKDKGMALAYIDSRDVQDRLDHVCGANWQCAYSHAAQKTVCDIGILIDGQWVWRADGAGDTDVEQEKGALSDAFKRAAVKWGIGRYLYDIESPWVAITPKDKSYVIAEHEFARLQKLLPGSKAETAPAPKDQGQMGGPRNVTTLKAEMREFARDLEACSDADELNALIMKSQDLLAQCQRDLPDWYFGKDGSDVKGCQHRITERTADLNKPKMAAE